MTGIEGLEVVALNRDEPIDIPGLGAIVADAGDAVEQIRQSVSDLPQPLTVECELGIVGRTDAMQELFKRIGQLARSDVTALITGESGTGKELVARAIYEHGKRNQQPFLIVNCPAIPEQLIESELFGHERGAFTGAKARRVGRFEQCNQGTLFLDGVGDMSFAAQAKVLRVLQSGTFERVGGNKTIEVDVRIIAASKEPLEEAVAARRFREDLFYRLNVVRLAIPPLRERRQDIPLLVDHFLKKVGREQQRLPRAFVPAVMEVLQRYTWPGNVRELENVIRGAAVLSNGDAIQVNDLPGEILNIKSVSQNASIAADVAAVAHEYFCWAKNAPGVGVIDTVHRELLAQALLETEGNQNKAAKLLGITRTAVRSQMTRFNLRANCSRLAGPVPG